MNWYKKAEISEKPTINVACVGGVDNNINDKSMITLMHTWLYQHDISFVYKNFVFDNINLYDNRDFLKENNQYDIVAILSVFAPDDRLLEKVKNTLFDRSDIHSRDEWVKALLRANPEYIFAFGAFQEVSGSYLGNISGYQKIDASQGFMTVYSKGNIPQEEESRPDWENVDVEWLKDFGDEKDELV